MKISDFFTFFFSLKDLLDMHILTLQNPLGVHLSTEETLHGAPELVLKAGDFAFQAPEAWAAPDTVVLIMRHYLPKK